MVESKSKKNNISNGNDEEEVVEENNPTAVGAVDQGKGRGGDVEVEARDTSTTASITVTPATDDDTATTTTNNNNPNHPNGRDDNGNVTTTQQQQPETNANDVQPGAYRVYPGERLLEPAGFNDGEYDGAPSPIPSPSPSASPADDDEEHIAAELERLGIPLVEATPVLLPELAVTRVDPIEATLIPLYEAIVIDDDNAGEGSDVDDDTNVNGEMRSLNYSANGRNRTRLLEEPMKAADSGRSSSLSHQLHLSNMKLHGREDDMTLLSVKLFELKRGVEEGNSTDALPELILISGVSGTGKSTLVMRGARDPTEEMGMTFVEGKFDLNKSSMPFAAFVDAMASLTNYVIEWDQGHKIQYDLKEALREEDIMLLVRALPGSEGLFPQQIEEIYRKRASQPSTDKVAIASQQYETLSLIGKRGIARLHHKIRRLLGIICTHLKGVVLFIDDLQVRRMLSILETVLYFAHI